LALATVASGEIYYFMDRMNKLSDLRSLSIFQSLIRSTSMAMKTANPKPSTYGSFAYLKTTTGSDFIFAFWFLLRRLP
jgi:hypothetical protein